MAEAAAENGDLMMTQIRYADAARYYAEAVGLTPEKYAEQLSARLTDWALAAQDAGDYRTGLDAARRALALDEARLPAEMPSFVTGSTTWPALPGHRPLRAGRAAL